MSDKVTDYMVTNSSTNPSTINVNDEVELNRWAEFFGINKDKLKHAVNMVGPTIELIRRYLQK